MSFISYWFKDLSFKETKSLVCLFCGDIDMFGP